MSLLPLPAQVTPQLHAAFFADLEASSSIAEPEEIGHWTVRVAAKWGTADWRRRAAAIGQPAVTGSLHEIVRALLHAHLARAAAGTARTPQAGRRGQRS